MNQVLTPEEFWEAYCDHNMDLNKEELYYDEMTEVELFSFYR